MPTVVPPRTAAAIDAAFAVGGVCVCALLLVFVVACAADGRHGKDT